MLIRKWCHTVICAAAVRVNSRCAQGARCRAYSVEVRMLSGKTEKLEMDEGDTMLDAMIDAGLEPTHDCKMGVCMTCPARLVRPSVCQSCGAEWSIATSCSPGLPACAARRHE